MFSHFTRFWREMVSAKNTDLVARQCFSLTQMSAKITDMFSCLRPLGGRKQTVSAKNTDIVSPLFAQRNKVSEKHWHVFLFAPVRWAQTYRVSQKHWHCFASFCAKKRCQRKTMTQNDVSVFDWHAKQCQCFWLTLSNVFSLDPISTRNDVSKKHWPCCASLFFADTDTKVCVSRNHWP